MSYMSTLATAGITVEEMSAYLAEHPGVTFDEAVRAIENESKYVHTARRDWEREMYKQCDKEDREAIQKAFDAAYREEATPSARGMI